MGLGCSPSFPWMLGCPSSSMRSSNICSTFLTNEVLIMVLWILYVIGIHYVLYCKQYVGCL